MKKQFYAVVVGRIPGSYTSWADCKKQVDGFSHAKFKGFKREYNAQDYLKFHTSRGLPGLAITGKSTTKFTDQPKTTNPAGIKHLYTGKLAPWEYTTNILCYPDLLRLEAHLLLQEAEQQEITI